MVTLRLSVSARQEIGTARAKDKFFDLNGIETQQRSEALWQSFQQHMMS